MKILRLHFRNLNSLAGEWSLDFTHPDFVTSGIFAITGPTGAGKTTILDGICLALYGQTPRLGRITQGGNELMSRQTGECSAEVEFETGRGRFRCSWSQHRSRKQADGKLQSPRHEIAEANSGTILESTLTTVVKLVEEVTGMDFDRFTRSMLLAQGGFAAFLQARPDERAPLLEQITGTEIYSLISLKVHERTVTERKKVETIQEELKGVQLLSPQEEEGAQRQLVEKKGADLELAAVTRRLQEEQAWRERLVALENELVTLEEAWQQFSGRKLAAEPDRALLERAQRARGLEGDQVRLLAVRRRQAEAATEREHLIQRLSRLNDEVGIAGVTLASAEAAWVEAQARQLRDAELFRTVRHLDTRLEETGARLAALEREIGQVRQQSASYRAAMAQGDALQGKAAAALREVERQLTERAADAGLVESLTGIGEQLKVLQTLDRRRKGGEGRLAEQQAVVAAAVIALTEADRSRQMEAEQLAQADEQVRMVAAARAEMLQGDSLPFWRSEAERLWQRSARLQTVQEMVLRRAESERRLGFLKEQRSALADAQEKLVRQETDLAAADRLQRDLVSHLQDKVILLGRVRDLESERKLLLEGSPCPLCGATEHPYAVGNVPRADEAQRQLEEAWRAAEVAARRLNDVTMQMVQIETELKQLIGEMGELETRQTEERAALQAGLAEQGLPEGLDGAAEVIATALQSTLEEAESRRRVIAEIDRTEDDERLARAACEEARVRLARCNEMRQAADLGQRGAVAELARLQGEQGLVVAELAVATREAAAAVAPFGLAVGPADGEAVMAALDSRRREHLERLEVREELRRSLAGLESGREKQEALLAAAERDLGDKESSLVALKGERDSLLVERRQLYGDRSPDAGEMVAAEALTAARERREAALMAEHRLRTERQGGAEQLAKVQESQVLLLKEQTDLEVSFRLRVTAAGFVDEADFDAAHLPEERLAALAGRFEALQREETEIRARRLDRAENLRREQGRELTLRSLPELVTELEAVSLRRQEVQQEIGGIEERLRRHGAQKELFQARAQHLDRQKQECARWERLHLLIGSSDGKKFRNFAQGLTFELMVAHANRQLQKMSDRYLLIRDEAEPLELNVIDQYQAGETRSTKNLSGGESFIVSLALALGLSSMASRKVRVDSLFLDEGFGTLDEETLETALETLAGLQREGKLIGIISHVGALQERIATQIRVAPGSGGRSRISGPGCQSL